MGYGENGQEILVKIMRDIWLARTKIQLGFSRFVFQVNAPAKRLAVVQL